MNKLFLSDLIASLALLSCYKQGHHGNYHGSRLITIDTTIASGTQYQLNLQPYGDADDLAAIKTQALNYTSSEIVNTGSGFSPVYHFSATASTKLPLSEQVIIAITEGNHGHNHPNTDSALITINFNVK